MLDTFRSSNRAAQDGVNRTPLTFRAVGFDSLLVAFVVIYALVGMRNFDLRIAALFEDSGPILLAYAFRDPSLFEGDYLFGVPMGAVLRMGGLTSATNWIPALLWRYVGIDPFPMTWFITLLQVMLVGLSIYLLARSMVRDRVVSMLSALFAYVAAPWAWNLANYGHHSWYNFYPYGAHLAYGPALLAFAYLIRARTRMVLGLLLLAGLIHPNLTIYAGAVVGLYWLWESLQAPTKNWWHRLAALAGIGILVVLPAFLVRASMSADSLPRDEIIAGMRQSQHHWPWGNNRWDASLQACVQWLILALLSWRWYFRFSFRARRLWLATFVVVIMFTISHVVGGICESPFLLTIDGQRSWVWLSLASLPLIVYYWIAHIRSGHGVGAALSLLCLGLPFFASEYALFGSLIVGLSFLDISQGHLSIFRLNLPRGVRRGFWLLALCVLIGWCVAFVAMPFGSVGPLTPLLEAVTRLTWDVPSWVALPDRIGRCYLVAGVAAFAALTWRWSHLGRQGRVLGRSILIAALVPLGGASLLLTQWQTERTLALPASRSMLDVQLWARESSPSSSLFVVPYEGGWRTMSLRRKLSPFTWEEYSYAVPRQAAVHRNRLLDFYGITVQEGRELRGWAEGSVASMERERF